MVSRTQKFKKGCENQHEWTPSQKEEKIYRMGTLTCNSIENWISELEENDRNHKKG